MNSVWPFFAGLTRREWLRVSSVAVAANCSAVAWGEDTTRLTAAEAKVFADRLRPLHVKKRRPQRGEWLDQHKEAGQTFDEYLSTRRRRVCEQHQRFYLQPLGEFTGSRKTALDQTAECMEAFFGMPVVIAKPVSLDDLPAEAKRVHPSWNVPQVLSTYLLDKVLKPRRPADAVAVLGLTNSDLWPGKGWNFVFGQASLTDRVGVWSLHRNGNPDASADEYRTFLRRTLKTAMHETGHMLGIPHCIAYECGMNGSNHREESDATPLEFCPECQAKVWWTCGVRPERRCAALLAFAEKHGLSEEADAWRRSQAALGGK